MELNKFKAYLDSLTYDKYYQDIECIGFVGYSESYKTWKAIEGIVNWENKKVADLGCFHGYFCFKMAQRGAKATGFEKSSTVLKTTEIINGFGGKIIETKEWIDTDEVPKGFDIVLCLNALHHFEDGERVLKEIDCETMIFEINETQETLVNKYFEILKRIPSHRKNRIILLTKRIGNEK